MDFGIAGLIDNNIAEKSKAGSLKYMAPEVLTEENIEARPSLDVWSMGCLLYGLVCGELPFLGKTVAEITSHITKCDYHFPTDLKLTYHCRNLISKMLTVDYKTRISLEDILSHPWMEGNSPGHSPVKPSAITNEKKIDIKCLLVPMQKSSRPIKPKLTKQRTVGCSRKPKSSFRFPLIDKQGISSKNASMGEQIEGACVKKSRIKKGSLLGNDMFSEKGKGSHFVFHEYENIPSFMLPIRRTKEEKMAENIFKKAAKYNNIRYTNNQDNLKNKKNLSRGENLKDIRKIRDIKYRSCSRKK